MPVHQKRCPNELGWPVETCLDPVFVQRSAWSLSELEFEELRNIGALDVVEETVTAGASPADARKWWLGELDRRANDAGVEVSSLPITPEKVMHALGRRGGEEPGRPQRGPGGGGRGGRAGGVRRGRAPRRPPPMTGPGPATPRPAGRASCRRRRSTWRSARRVGREQNNPTCPFRNPHGSAHRRAGVGRVCRTRPPRPAPRRSAREPLRQTGVGVARDVAAWLPPGGERTGLLPLDDRMYHLRSPLLVAEQGDQRRRQGAWRAREQDGTHWDASSLVVSGQYLVVRDPLASDRLLPDRTLMLPESNRNIRPTPRQLAR